MVVDSRLRSLCGLGRTGTEFGLRYSEHGDTPGYTRGVFCQQDHNFHESSLDAILETIKSDKNIEARPHKILYMNPENKRARSIGFYTFLVSIILSPVIFWPSVYIALDTTKTITIGLGVLISAMFLCFTVLKENRLTLPPRKIFWTSLLIIVSLIISALLSIHAGKSLFGQGFEINTVSFLATLFVGGLVTFTFVSRRLDRAIILYVGIFVAYFVVYMFHVFRLIFGASLASFSVFLSQTSSMLGEWPNVGTYSIVVALVSLCAILFLSLSKRMKFAYWVIFVLSAIAAFIVSNTSNWSITFLVLLGLTIFLSMKRVRSQDHGIRSAIKHIAWLPLIICIITFILAWKGDSIAHPIAKSMGISYVEVSLPWRATLDVTSGVIKSYPIFGIGANHFSTAYMNWKPDGINMGDGWSYEFTYGFSLISTLVTEQGLAGLVLWVMFFVFLVLMGVRVLRSPLDNSPEKFVITSSFVVSVFLWLVALTSIPSHAILFLTLTMTGIFLGVSVNSGVVNPIVIEPRSGRGSKFLSIIIILALIVALVWAIIYVKKVVALSYFGAGVKHLTVEKNYDLALSSFIAADKVDHLDVYLQGKAEARLAKANTIAALAAKAAEAKNASSSDSLAKQFGETINAALIDARAAVDFDKSDYYNHISEARVSEVAASLKMQNAYDNASKAYMQAIGLNPKNPSIFLSLAKFQLSQDKLDDALKTIGTVLQLKPNYLDAVFLLSQVYAAKNDLPNAIIAAKFATELNPQNPQVFFQLGLLQYNNKDSQGAVTSFGTALKIQPEYANAQYFLGLAYAELGKTSDAIAQFTALSKSNPDNQEILGILKNLGAGKSIFVNPQSATSPEKRSTLPIKTKK